MSQEIHTETLRDRAKPYISKKKSIKNNSAGAVTFLDVLGWKGIWRESSEDDQESALDILTTFIEEIKRKANEIVKSCGPNALDDGNDFKVDLLSVSDTIVFFTIGTAKEAIGIHAKLCSWTICNALERGLPLRGAISYGFYDHNATIMIGPAVDEAASWHESTDWIGVILTPSAQIKLNDTELTNVTSYSNIPFKHANKELIKCVDWDFKDRKKLHELFIKKGPHMQDVAPKYLNTLAFLNRNNGKKKRVRSNKHNKLL